MNKKFTRVLAASAVAVTFGIAATGPVTAAQTAPSQLAGNPAIASITAKANPNSTVAKTDLGPSAWKGEKLTHPGGGSFDPSVTRWANVTLVAMKDQGIPRKYLPGILSQMQQESSGNPKAINNTDINAQNGVPSKGLMQVIAPTYTSYAAPGLKSTKYQENPYANIYASLGYVKAAYGMGKFASWNAGANQCY